MELKVTKVGNSVGIVLPKEMLTRLKAWKGARLGFTEAPDGYRITAYDPEFGTQIEAARRRRHPFGG